MDEQFASFSDKTEQPINSLVLRKVYKICDVLAGGLLVALLLLVTIQIASRAFGTAVPGVQDFSAYSLAAIAFLSLGPSLIADAHVRVNLFTAHLSGTAALALCAGCFLAGAVVAGYMAYWSVDLVWDSYDLGELATALLPIPLWIPRLSMALGCLVMCLAFLDELNALLRSGSARHHRPAT